MLGKLSSQEASEDGVSKWIAELVGLLFLLDQFLQGIDLGLQRGDFLAKI